MADNNGEFTCKFAWKFIRTPRAITLTGMIAWHPKLPYKVSFFILRLMHYAIPTDDKIRRLGYKSLQCVSVVEHLPRKMLITYLGEVT